MIETPYASWSRGRSDDCLPAFKLDSILPISYSSEHQYLSCVCRTCPSSYYSLVGTGLTHNISHSSTHMIPTMPSSPAAICLATSDATLGWFKWFLLELPCEQSTMMEA